MAQVYYDKDAKLAELAGRTIAILGYGNQGRAQALNLRDAAAGAQCGAPSGGEKIELEIIVGNIRDDSFAQAEADGFTAMPIAEAARRADILFLLLPDEVQQEVYRDALLPVLRPGMALNFAHGYNIRYGHIQPPEGVDVIMVAPRMIGVGVRDLFLSGAGAPAFVAVERDATGRAWPLTLAIAKGIGATRAGALVTTFAEETELDHFMEQAVWPSYMRVMQTAWDVLTARGFQPETILMELYRSGESAKIMEEMAAAGMFRQMAFHSHTSQYGTLSRTPRVLPENFRETFERALDAIQSGDFAREWEAERAAGYPVFNTLKAGARSHPINTAEDTLNTLLGGGKD